jgi:hypothetical protein
MDTVKSAQEGYRYGQSLREGLPVRVDVLDDAFNAWLSLEGVRKEAELNKMYVYGDQWGERVETRPGIWMTERESIRRQGNTPITNNRLRSMVSSVTGMFVQNKTEPVCVARERENQQKGEVMTATLQYVYQLNKAFNLDASNLTNLLLSGTEISRTSYGYREGKADVWVDNINYSRFFFDQDLEDIRVRDCRLAGELSDMSVYDAMALYSGGDRTKAEIIRDLYGSGANTRVMPHRYSSGYRSDAYRESSRSYRDFYSSDTPGKARVITVWRKEAKERLLVHDWLHGELYMVEVDEETYLKEENSRRRHEWGRQGVLAEDMKLLEWEWRVDNYWYYYVLTPGGHVLEEGESPYSHGGHPYSFRLYKLYDKQIFPYVSGFRDQQRYINRLIMMQDFMMRASAKGVLLVPQECIDGTDLTPEEFADQWKKFNGVIVYSAKSSGGAIPQQITANTTNLGVYDMLSVQMRMIEDSSGIQGALQGQAPQSGTPASLYLQQTQNSSVSLSEIFEYHNMYREERDMKMLKLIQQYYTDARFVNVAGNRDMVYYDPASMRDIEFELSITESVQTPLYRAVTNDMLMQLYQLQAISIEQLLELGSFPFADKLMQSLQSRNEQAARLASSGAPLEASQLPGIPQEVVQEVESQSNPQAVRMLRQGLSG